MLTGICKQVHFVREGFPRKTVCVKKWFCKTLLECTLLCRTSLLLFILQVNSIYSTWLPSAWESCTKLCFVSARKWNRFIFVWLLMKKEPRNHWRLLRETQGYQCWQTGFLSLRCSFVLHFLQSLSCRTLLSLSLSLSGGFSWLLRERGIRCQHVWHKSPVIVPLLTKKEKSISVLQTRETKNLKWEVESLEK